MRTRPRLLGGTLLAFVVVGAACSGGGKGSGDSTPTYWADVAPILRDNCQGCHVEGGIAPFAFGTYTTASAVALTLQAAVNARTMPPSTIDNSGDCNTWTDARWLSDEDLATLNAWVDGGKPEGDPADAPPAPTPLPALAEVDETLDIGFDYMPPDGQDEYRCFIVDPSLAGTNYLTAFEVKPGDPAIVHHMVLFMPSSEAAETNAAALDTGDAGPGYECFGGPGSASSVLATWAPGTGATFFASGTGIPIPAGRRLVVQIHYNTEAASGTDRTLIDIDLESSGVQPAIVIPFQSPSFSLDPGQSEAEVVNTIPVPATGQIHAIFPHMHTRGRRMLVEYLDGGSTTCIADVDRWNFHWQQYFTASSPISVEIGNSIRVTCVYDTTLESAPVTQGENTDQEMCFLGFYATGP